MKIMKQAYPVLIAEEGKFFLVFVPDMELYTQGMSMADAIYMARDIIGLHGIGMEDDNEELPEPSTCEEAIAKAKADADEIFDYSKGILTFVDVDFAEYRKEQKNRTVRRNVSLPNWLNIAAEKAGINVSAVLREALQKVLGKEEAR